VALGAAARRQLNTDLQLASRSSVYAITVIINSFLASASIPFAENAYTVLEVLESRRDEDPSARAVAARPWWIRSARSAGMRLHSRARLG
jgi:hypothetical protein